MNEIVIVSTTQSNMIQGQLNVPPIPMCICVGRDPNYSFPATNAIKVKE